MGVKIEYKGHRLINTKYPPIALFDDVASPEEFEMLYAIQALTNPRLRDEVGDICLIDPAEIPFNCLRGRSYAVAPFTHINPKGGDLMMDYLVHCTLLIMLILRHLK
ncbi:hypothetical protein PDPE_1-02936 [Photobacterium damselae subsp. piscicida]|nr:hypothetical protein [Photobacterium damselae subsp. piscicida]BBC42095.1 hypothetical protein PDPE_1-02936 [Photobacterium damselae subsp. piscicida]